MRTELDLLRRWSAEDWMWACLLIGSVICARMAGAETPAPVHTQGLPWPELEWRVTMGNLLTLVGLVWWIGRWGAKQVMMLDKLPTLLGELERRLELLEDHGCSRVKEHRAVLRAIGDTVGEDPDA